MIPSVRFIDSEGLHQSHRPLRGEGFPAAGEAAG